MERRDKMYTELESELNQIFTELGMEPNENRAFMWLKELIMIAVRSPAVWSDSYLEDIGKRENLTRERVRQLLWRTAAEKWNFSKGCEVLCNHFGDSVEINFTIKSKPSAEEFVTLLADNLRAKYQIQPHRKRLR